MSHVRVARLDPTAQNKSGAAWMLLSSLAVMLVVFAFMNPAAARGTPESFADLVDETRPAVVSIATIKTVSTAEQQLPFEIPEGSPLEDWFKDFFERYNQGEGPNGGGNGESHRRMTLGEGSGFFISADGYVVTNYHVIEDADEIRIVTVDDEQIEATLVGSDDKLDLALLKVEPQDEPFPFLEWGDNDALRIGDWVMAIGNPRGLGGSVTAGIVSQKSRDISRGPYDAYIQTDAAINPGNSGGPLISMDGEVVGVNTLIFTNSGGSQGLGFSVPANRARLVIEQLREFGEARRGWLGVRIQVVDESIAASIGLENPRGAFVQSVTPGSPAEAGAVQEGDVILSFDGTPIERMQDLPWIVAKTEVGSTVPVVVWRDEREVTLRITVAKLDEEQVAQAQQEQDNNNASRDDRVLTLDGLGLGVTALDDQLREDLDLPRNLTGVIVTETEDLGPAQESGLQQGDIITEVNQTNIESPRDLQDVVEEAADANRKAVLMKIYRDGRSRFLGVPFKD